MFANSIHVKMLNGFRQGVSDGSGDHDHEDHDHDDTELTNNVATNTSDIASLADDITPEYSTAFDYKDDFFESNSTTMTGGGWQVAGYLRVKHGDRYKVTLRGVVKRVGGGNIGGGSMGSVHIITLPAGYRPPGACSFMTVGHKFGSPPRHWINIDINGATGALSAYATEQFRQMNLDGIEFWTT